MFGWLSRCWGGMGVTSGFEKARLECTYADWASPNPRSLISTPPHNRSHYGNVEGPKSRDELRGRPQQHPHASRAG